MLPDDVGQGARKTRPTPQDFATGVLEQQVRLVQLNGEGEGRTFALEHGETLLGAGSDCQIIVTDRAVSRKHCLIERGDTFIRVRDLGSTNGTRLDEIVVESAFLRSGSRLRLGDTVFGVEVAYQPLSAVDTAKTRGGFRGLVGQSPRMQSVFAARDQLAGSDVTVLIQGETGTGKSALARSIHGASARRQAPCVVFDCAAVAPSLIESTLFGHEKGAFTGAVQQKLGVIETAGEGTLFIDELGELPSELQPKLLRALEEREFTRVGGTKALPVKCRVIAASQHDVWKLVEEGKFRQDLYFRLAVFTVPLPPLRERKEDIPLIVNQLFDHMGVFDRQYEDLAAAAKEEINQHDWPGNIRELRNYLERLVAMPNQASVGLPGGRQSKVPVAKAAAAVSGDELMLSVKLDPAKPYRDQKEAAIEQIERAYFETLLKQSKNNVSEVARRSGINRRHVYDLLQKLGLGKSDE